MGIALETPGSTLFLVPATVIVADGEPAKSRCWLAGVENEQFPPTEAIGCWLAPAGAATAVGVEEPTLCNGAMSVDTAAYGMWRITNALNDRQLLFMTGVSAYCLPMAHDQ